MARPLWKRTTIAAVKAIVAIVVLWAVGRHVWRTWDDLAKHRVTIQLEPIWLAASGLLYLAGLSACGMFYWRILHDSATPIATAPALRAYLVSHLGKYVPGKAMVVVMRAGMSVPFGARGATAAIATFYETLVMMAAGGLVAAAGFALAGGSGRVAFVMPGWGPVSLPLYRLAAISGLGLGLAFLVVVAPPIFTRLVGWVSLPIPGVGPEALPRLSGGLLARGLGWSSLGWLLLGLSQIAVIRALGGRTAAEGLPVGLAGAVVAAVALATLAGFVVAVLPGGLGVREGVLMAVLSPALGHDRAIVAALSLRLVWVAAELVAAAILVPALRPTPPAPGAIPEPAADHQTLTTDH
ncbi:MAG: lysylphosphatidylglycerol synthase domain-containing protein [Isosphaeraceae bacterium]